MEKIKNEVEVGIEMAENALYSFDWDTNLTTDEDKRIALKAIALGVIALTKQQIVLTELIAHINGVEIS